MADYLFGATDTGRVSKNNEDVFIALEVMNGQFIIAGVIDGVGGYEGGEVAAALTKEVVLTELSAIGADLTAQLEIAFSLANEEILAKKLGELQLLHMACVATVAVIDVQRNLFHYIHVGDTRLYLYRDNSLVKISHDQSPVGFLEDSGRLTEEAAMQHPKRNQVNQALGLGSLEDKAEGYFETGSSPFLPGDLLLVCSDGLTDLVDKAAIAAVLGTANSLEEKTAQLIDLANAAGGKDNITIVLARNDKPVVQHELLPPLQENVVKDPFVQAAPAVGAAPAAPTATPVWKEDSQPVQDTLAVRQYTRGPLLLLSVLCLLFLASTLWLFFTNPPVKLNSAASLDTVVVKPLNAQEKMLQDTLGKLKGDTLKLAAAQFKGLIRLSRALSINRDTLVIKTDGKLILQSDTAYRGTALILSPVCQYVVIDGLTLENFDTGIAAAKNVLEIKNMHFNNCKHALQVWFDFAADTFVSGRVSKRAFQADSVAKK